MASAVKRLAELNLNATRLNHSRDADTSGAPAAERSNDYICAKARRELAWDVLDKMVREKWSLVPGVTITLRNLLDRLALVTWCKGHAWAEFGSKSHLAAWLATQREESNAALDLGVAKRLIELGKFPGNRIRLRLEPDDVQWKDHLRLSAEELGTVHRSVRDPGDPGDVEFEPLVGPNLGEPFLDAKLEAILARIEASDLSAVPTAPQDGELVQRDGVSAVPTVTPQRQPGPASQVSAVPTAWEKAQASFRAIRAGTWAEPPANPQVSAVPTVARVAAAAAVRSSEVKPIAAAAMLVEFERLAVSSGQWGKFKNDWQTVVEQDPDYARSLLKDFNRRNKRGMVKGSPLGLLFRIASDEGRWIGGENVGKPSSQQRDVVNDTGRPDRNAGPCNENNTDDLESKVIKVR